MARRKIDSWTRIAAALAGAAILLAGCGTAAEPGSATFLREHGAEARRAAAAVTALSAAVEALPAKATRAQLEALALATHGAHRALLAAANWNVTENGEEEGVSQAEKEIHEGAEALLDAEADARLYALRGRPASLIGFRHELAAGREYWDQGISQLWYVAKKPGAPKI